MKKFLAIVMCLAMALSMMTVVSFAAPAAYEISFGAIAEAAPGDTVNIPVYLTNDTNETNAIGGLQFTIAMPEAFKDCFTVTAGTLASSNYAINGGVRIGVLVESNKELSTTDALFTIALTIPSDAAGDYALATASDWLLYTTDYEEEYALDMADAVVKVKAAVTTPTVEETFVDTNPVDGQPSYLCVLQPAGNVTKMGIKCDGYDTFWAYADNECTFATTMAAVQVIGLKDATFTTVVE